MAAVQVDLHVIERLVGSRFDTVNAATSAKLLPGEQPPSDPTTPFTQYLGCDFDTVLRNTGSDESQLVNVTAEFLCAAPVTITRGDAYQVMTAASAVVAVIAEFSSSGSDHVVHFREATVRRVVIDELPMYRCVMITAKGTAERTTGTSLE